MSEGRAGERTISGRATAITDTTITDAERATLARLVMGLRRRGIRPEILVALEEVPRRIFLAHAFQHEAYVDQTLPIECGETIPPPSLTALILSALELGPGLKVLDIGTGTGFQAAMLARLAGRVITLERYRTLAELARSRFATLKIGNLTALAADGADGFARHAPYDRIVINAAVAEPPETILEQLTEGGVLVAPVGLRRSGQRLVRIRRTGRTFERTDLGPSRFPPLVPGLAMVL